MRSSLQLRAAGPNDERFVRSMTHQALYAPDGSDPFPASVLDDPAIEHYFRHFGQRPGDLGLIAVDTATGTDVGACWARQFDPDDPGYGWIAADVPELSIALLDDYQRQALGTRLLTELMSQLAEAGVGRVSLSVDSRSPAYRLYTRLGFRDQRTEGDSITMVRHLT